MFKLRESGGFEELQNDIEFLFELSCSIVYFSVLEYCIDVCEWIVSVLSRFMLGKNSFIKIIM